MRIVAGAIGVALVLYAVVCAAVFAVQRRLLYFPSHEDAAGVGTAEFRPWRDAASSELLGYVREATSGAPRRVVVVFHGNGGEAIHRAWYGELVDRGATTMVLAEYPGYGARPGEPTEATIRASARALLTAVRARWSGVPIVVLGESLGSGVASDVASVEALEALVLVTPFSSAVDVGQNAYPFLPVSLLMQDRYDSIQALRKVTTPLWIAHGTRDETVPLALAQRLFDAYAGPQKRFLLVAGAGHNDVGGRLLRGPEGAPLRDFLSLRR